MKTDKQLFLIFYERPDWLFLLTGMPSPGKCRFRSLVVKALERIADGLVVPVAIDQKLTLIEFQFWPDAEIYLRMVEEMTAAQRAYDMRDIQAFLFVEKQSLDPQTAPWNKVVQCFVLRDLVLQLAASHPGHPLNAVFQPLLEPDDCVVETQSVINYRAIKTSQLEPKTRDVLLDVFVNWLEQRLPHKGRKEIEMMLLGELPNLEDTQSGKDLIRIGEARGEARGWEQAIVLLLQTRFGRITKTLQSRIERLSAAEAKELITQIQTWNKLQDAKDWLDGRGQ